MKHRIASIALIAGLASAALADVPSPGVWAEEDSGGYQNVFEFGILFEDFDAGKRLSTANMTEGPGVLDTIQLILAYKSDVDLFAINIDDPAAFSATGSINWEYSLALFDASGAAIAYNGSNGTPGAAIDSTLTAGLAPGLYYLAVVEDELDAGGTTYTGPANAIDGAGAPIFDLTDPLLQIPPMVAGTVLGTQDEVVAGDDVAGPWTHPVFSPTFFSSTFINITLTGASYAIPAPSGCNAADIAEPFDVLDLADIQAFVAAFVAQEPAADIAPPAGVWDLADLQAFIVAFTGGCP